MAKQVVQPGGGGMIVRTVGEEITKKKLENEYGRLHRQWTNIGKKARSAKAPTLLHREAQLVSSVIRDLFSDKFDAIRIDSRAAFKEVVEYVESADPDLADRIHLYRDPVALFDKYGVEEEIQRAFRRTVQLKSGGHIVIEATEALVSIDVNTGRFTGKGRKDPNRRS